MRLKNKKKLKYLRSHWGKQLDKFRYFDTFLEINMYVCDTFLEINYEKSHLFKFTKVEK